MTKKFTDSETADFCREMALMLHAGIGAAEAISLLSEEVSDPKWKTALTGMLRLTDEGAPFAAAVKQQEAFPAYMTGLIEVGERTGNLEEALTSLASFYDERGRMNARIRSALLYPSVLFLLMMAVIVVLLTQVLPMFESVYVSLGGSMTGAAGALLRIGQGMNRIMPVLCVLLGIIALALIVFSVSESFRELVLRFWRSYAGDKGVMRKLNDACLAQAIAMGLGSGLNAEETMALAAQVLGDIPVAQARCDRCRQQLEKGESLVDALCEADVLPPAMRRLLALGVQSGSGDEAMRSIASRLSDDADAALGKKVARVEPALVLACSVLVGAVLLSVMLPLIDVMEMIG